jgi:CheY-like chemotaxis protein
MNTLRILVVEDDPLIGMLLGDLLIEQGHSVCGIVMTEQEAVASAARHAPDLMLVDVNLKAGSGISAMATIMQSGKMPHVFMTGAPRSDIPAGAAILQKPFWEPDLVRALALAMMLAENT